MIDRKCSKNYPKRFSEHTSIDGNGFSLHRRRNDGRFVEKLGVQLDNRNVVAYNKYLLKRYQAHISVEMFNQASCIKYLFKYINNGPDRATVAVVESSHEEDDDKSTDEIKEYYDCRYVSAFEASWRILRYDIHYRTPSVLRLPFHLPRQQQYVFGAKNDIENAINKTFVASSMFLAWMKFNELYEKTRKLMYVEFPTEFLWNRRKNVLYKEVSSNL